MSDPPRPSSAPPPARRAMKLVPRLRDGGYDREQVDERRRWVEEATGARLDHLGSYSIPSEEMRGNVENPVGAAQVPVGVAGPLLVHGEHADGSFYVPLATTEGALVRSYERGIAALTRSGGATVRLERDENRVSPIFTLPDVAAASELARGIPERFDDLRRAAEATTGHGKLLAVLPQVVGRRVILEMRFSTGDAHGMNMIVRAADAACRLVAEETGAPYLVFSGHESEKRTSGGLLAGGKGKRVAAGARLPRRVVSGYLHSTPEELADLWTQTVTGNLAGASVGYNGHYANGLTALFIALGQDVANVANSAVGITHLEAVDGDLHASVTLPSLTVATVGGGTSLGTAPECLEMLGCRGAGRAAKLAEIVAATLLAGELSMGAAIASGEFVDAHETYGRNRPERPSERPDRPERPSERPDRPERPSERPDEDGAPTEGGG